MHRRRLLALAVVLVVGCDGSEPATTPPSIATSTAAPVITAAPAGTIPPFEEVALALSSEGTYLIDEQGRSLYMFALDDERNATCVGACAEAWPPLYGDPVTGDGLDQDLAGNVEREDGSIQVMYGGHPLYLYTGDSGPGDTNGHGFNDVWFLVGPDGQPLEP